MKKTLVFLLLLLITVGCNAQVKQLTYTLKPSFIDSSKVLIEKSNNGYSLSISNSTINEKRVITESSMAELQQLFVNYAQTKKTEDSLETIRRQKEMEMNGGIYNHVVIVDGMCVGIEVVDINGITSIKTCNPFRGTINYQLTSALFALMRSTFQKPETITYLYELGNYL